MFEYVSEEQKRRYINAVSHVYYGLCIDIDNTIIDIENHDEVLDRIAQLLKRRVPVVFMTSFTKNEVKDFKEKLIEELTKRECDRSAFDRINIILNNGEKILYSKPFYEEPLTEEKISGMTLKNAGLYRLLFEELKDIAKCHNATDVFLDEDRIIGEYILDQYTNVLTLKVKLNDLSDEDRLELLEETFLYLDYYNNDLKNNLPVHVTIAKLNGEEYLLINKNDKNDLLSFVESLIGIKERQMMIIGNNGSESESNYQLLNRENAFTTDTTSTEIYNCHPVTDKGRVLKNDEAICYLLDHGHFVPSVCLDSISNDNYDTNYAEFVYRMMKETKKYLRSYNDFFNRIFDVTEGMKDIFHETGAVKFSRVEWDLIPKNNPFKRFFSSKDENGNYEYILFDDEDVLLRGSSIYYYLLSHRNKTNNDGSELAWLSNTVNTFAGLEDLLGDVLDYDEYINTRKEDKSHELYVKGYDLMPKLRYDSLNLNSEVNKRFMLGILDNIRNALLIALNYKICKDGTDYTKHVNLENREFEDINFYFEILYITMYSLCFDETSDSKIVNTKDLLSKMVKELSDIYNEIDDGKIPDEWLKHIFRSYRENDSFIENYIAMKIVHDKAKGEEFYGVCGMAYGGLELPYLFNIAGRNYHPKSVIQYNRLYKEYKNLHTEDISDPEPLLHKYFLSSDYDKQTHDILLLDDNIMTGKSLQLAIDLLHRQGNEVTGVGVVKYPDVSRLEHMFKDSHGAVDYRLFMDYILGLAFASKYTWRDENDLHEYEDSLGYFDRIKKNIVECLVKNHDFTIESEVGKHIPVELAKRLTRKKD